MNPNQIQRLKIVLVGLGCVAAVLVFRLFTFSIVEADQLQQMGEEIQIVNIEARPQRGVIFDRNMTVLAGNGADYRIGASPNLVRNPEELATALAPILDRPRNELYALLTSDLLYVLLTESQVSAEVAEAVRIYEDDGIQIDPVPRRIYPQGELLCHTLGYTNFDGQGASGLEGYYETELAGQAASATINFSPLTEQQSVIAREGADLVLTIDRSVQFLVEQHLADALASQGAESGSIIVLDPKTGAIVAMASAPCFDPYTFFNTTDPSLFLNPAVSKQFEPGSVMKVLTMAAALDSGTVASTSTYYDSGVIEMGGQPMYNWDRSGPGTTDMETLLARSLNVGAATLAQWMGAELFYDYMLQFGFGQTSRVDLVSEALGQMPLPGDALWTETSLGTNSFGQGMAVTPLQMIAATSALANEGVMMQPYLVQEVRFNDGTVHVHDPAVSSRPVSAQTASDVTTMAVNAVRREVPEALVDGYTIAGKTSSAQIPVDGIYDPFNIIGVFIGWLPADNPELIVLVKIDKPQSAQWGSQTAAPVFGDLVAELVVMLDIPPDTVRLREDISRVRGN